jgi:hypothetical protein
MKKPAKKIVNVESYFIGDEPVWGDPKKEMHLIGALNWYSNQLSAKESKKFTLDFVKTNKYPKDIVEKLSSAQDWTFANLGFVCRMIQRGAKIDKVDWINKKIEQIITFIPSDSNISSASNTVTKPEKSIQDRVFDQATVYINEIEGHIDSYIKERTSTFKCYDYLKGNDIKPLYISHIKEHYMPLIKEITGAIKKEDDQLVESYSHWSKKELNAYLNFVTGVITDCDNYGSNTKTVRKTKKKKAVPLEKKVSSVKYKKEDSEFKVASVDPVTIIAAKQLWVFNSKYKTLGVYNSIDDSGFSIKGTTIEGFDSKTSIQKTLRKPLEILPIITKGKKSDLKKIMSTISTKEQTLTGRLNEEIILLKVIK